MDFTVEPILSTARCVRRERKRRRRGNEEARGRENREKGEKRGNKEREMKGARGTGKKGAVRTEQIICRASFFFFKYAGW